MQIDEFDFDSADIEMLFQETRATTSVPEPRFCFAPCNYALLNAKGEAYSQASSANLEAHLSIRMAKEPSTTGQARAWTWRKNCVLPRMHVTCSTPKTGQQLKNGAAVLLSAVTVDVLGHSAVEVGLEGDNLRPLVNGECTFSSLSFKTTSYNLKGKPMHLMATLLLTGGAEGGMHGNAQGAQGVQGLCVACAVLSPPILVYARKRTEKERGGHLDAAASAAFAAASSSHYPGSASAGDAGKLPPAPLPFAPHLLEKKLERVDKEDFRREIDNTMIGLRDYLSALNIRNKCKHPLFLVLRFNACVALMYDTTAVDSPLSDDETFYKMMASLSRLVGLSGAPSLATGATRELSPFIIAVKDSQADHQCAQPNCNIKDEHHCHRIDCPIHMIQLSAALSLPHSSTLPSTYRMLCDHQVKELRRTYCRLYCNHSIQIVKSLPTPKPAPKVPLCLTCGAPEADSDATPDSAQRQATSLLATLHQLSTGTYYETEAEGEAPCPEREWERGLLILAEAMAQHCRTRSAAEIVAFIQDEDVSASKKTRTHVPLAATPALTLMNPGPVPQMTQNAFSQFNAAEAHGHVHSHSHSHSDCCCGDACPEHGVGRGYVDDVRKHEHEHHL